MPDSRWLHRPRPRPAARMRLFCFPHAGGGAAAYRSWPDLIGEDIDIVAVRLPGRENRVVERRYRRMADAVTDLCPVIRPLLTLPYAFFGHSLGTLVAFALACRLDEGDAPAAAHLFAAASRAPHAPPRGPAPYELAVVPGGHFAASRAESGVTALVGAALRQGLPARRSG